ncbi:MAG: hypothetical protein IPM29_30960 [Planctomycetes bacterium]|nr:hypothetical protein [Planctomycetota bacterium]
MTSAIRIAFALLVALLTGCGSSDIVGVHVDLAADGSAVVTTRSLLPQEAPGPVEDATTGAVWRERVRLVCSRGDVAKLAGLRLDEIAFEARDGLLRVTVPCGPKVRWPNLFVPAAEAREATLRTFDPTGEQPSIGSRIRIEVQVPGRVIAVGAAPQIGSRTDHEQSIAWLELTVDSVRTREREVVWDVTWR